MKNYLNLIFQYKNCIFYELFIKSRNNLNIFFSFKIIIDQIDSK